MRAPFEHELEQEISSFEQKTLGDVESTLGTLDATLSFVEKFKEKAPALKKHYNRLWRVREELRQWAKEAGEPCFSMELRMRRLGELSRIFEAMGGE